MDIIDSVITHSHGSKIENKKINGYREEFIHFKTLKRFQFIEKFSIKRKYNLFNFSKKSYRKCKF